jgi:biopolymer transport protein TolR
MESPAMTTNQINSGAMSSEINVTPMIDVLLVLLIIFMVIVPAVPKGESALLPHPAKSSGGVDNAVVLELLEQNDGKTGFRINQHDVSREDLPAQLAAIYANRAERVLFVRGDDGLSFTQVADAIDIGHAAGADRVGLITSKVQTVQ